jgi:hypothetical protein
MRSYRPVNWHHCLLRSRWVLLRKLFLQAIAGNATERSSHVGERRMLQDTAGSANRKVRRM